MRIFPRVQDGQVSERRSCSEGKKRGPKTPLFEMSQKESPKPLSSSATHARKNCCFFDSRFFPNQGTAPGVRTLTTFLSTIPFACLGSPTCSQTATLLPLWSSFRYIGLYRYGNGTPQRGTGFFFERSLEVRAIPSIFRRSF